MIRKVIGSLLPKKLKLWVGHLSCRLFAWSVGYDPKKCMGHFYKSVFHQPMDWEDPKNLIEKINWLQLNTDTSLWTLCADKYRVREYVKSKGCEACLNELYGMWEDADSVDFDSLPNQFVLKANHGCGEVLLVKDKSLLDIKKTRKLMRKWLNDRFGNTNGQTHYTRIKPCIIAEKLLFNSSEPKSSLVDYKLWCFHGKPEFFLVAFNRGKNNHYNLSAFDLNWNNISNIILSTKNVHYCGSDFPKPASFDEMIRIAKCLSSGFPEVRVDFYDVDGHAVLGELTFTTGFGSYNKNAYLSLGSKINLTQI